MYFSPAYSTFSLQFFFSLPKKQLVEQMAWALVRLPMTCDHEIKLFKPNQPNLKLETDRH